MNIAFIDWIGSLIFLGGLIHLSYIDWRSFRLPNYWTKPLIFLGLIYHYHISLDLYPFILGAVLGYAIFWGVETAYRLFRKQEGLGRGDAKLLAAGGAWCGALALPFIILIASSTALFFVLHQGLDKSSDNKAELQLPFGPFLAGGIAVTFLTLKFI